MLRVIHEGWTRMAYSTDTCGYTVTSMFAELVDLYVLFSVEELHETKVKFKSVWNINQWRERSHLDIVLQVGAHLTKNQ